MATKKKYKVWIREVWRCGVEVEAESLDEAIDLAGDVYPEEVAADAVPKPGVFEYVTTLFDKWTVEALEECTPGGATAANLTPD